MSRNITYYSGNKKVKLEVQGLFEGRQAKRSGPSGLRSAGASGVRFGMRPQSSAADVVGLLRAQPSSLTSTRFRGLSESETMITPVDKGRTSLIPTDALSVTGAKAAEIKWLRKNYGFEMSREGSHGKLLLIAPGDAGDALGLVAEASRALYERGGVASAHPNFLRVIQRPGPAAPSGIVGQWGLDNPGGALGLPGADTAAVAAWTITQGVATIRVAVLDEGVDSNHPHLKPAMVAERDFVDGNAHGRPDGDDAHGTACAGIIGGRNAAARGLAPCVSLIGVRIAKGDGADGWIFDDFNTADAIDWSWDDADADVLSNSWGGGPPVDVITQAFGRARTQGRAGKGSVVVVAAGNAQGQVSYPGSLPDVLTVGASNQWDERKTKTSRDGENWWGSNFGRGLDLMAPGVKILTTDISGARGYSSGLTTPTFNGTSSATPFVAAAAALVLSARPSLTEAQVRNVLTSTCDPMGASRAWNQYTGFGRVNAFEAIRAARRLP
jgi:thermitase